MTSKADPPPVLPPVQAKAKTRWAWTVATFFGAGLLKPGPGTWGSLAAAALWYFAVRAAHPSPAIAIVGTIAGVLIATAIGIPAATLVEREAGHTDPGFVVIDEVAGQWLVLAAAPFDLAHAILAFVLFRFFDIVKPWPARQLERLPAGTGIVVDDLAAGVWGLLAMLLVRHWW
ncbi:MAG TPA: phosphatidylglycerophosphatase A [Acidobacteriaceae bacterium]|jgi:phosphatidylglycerophosphatase A|nr:phosphatidylglycerophosphatase A [Acidobacteriaceae bacterium]